MNFKKTLTSVAVASSALGAVASNGMPTAFAAVSTTVSTMTVKSGISLNVRSAASTNSAIKGTLSAGSKVTGYNQGNGWFKLNSGPYSGGYVSTSYLVANTNNTTSSNAVSSGTFKGYISKTLIKTIVHTSPSTSSGWLKTLNPGTPISGSLTGDWLKLNGGGYVNRGLITATPLSNGNLPSSRLRNVPVAWNSPGSWAPGYTPATVRKIDCYALKSLTGLENAYKAKFGRYARIDLAYRPLSEQNFWYKKFGYPRAAIPGTSNHGLGVAVDFRETDIKGEEFGWGGSGYTWLKSNGWKWGFRNTFVYGADGESYHWDFEGVN